MKTLEQTEVVSPNDRELLAEIKKVVHQFLPTATVLLYGSVARGTQEPESDYDILVLTDRPLTLAHENPIDDALYSLGLAWGAVIPTLFHSRDEWEMSFLAVSPFHNEVERDAIVL